MSEPSHLGIDIGTSGIKALLIDAGGARLAKAATPFEVPRPRPGWSERHCACTEPGGAAPATVGSRSALK